MNQKLFIKRCDENLFVGWMGRDQLCRDHHQFKHPTKKGKVTLRHPVKDIGVRDLKSIEKQSGLKF